VIDRIALAMQAMVTAIDKAKVREIKAKRD